MQTNRFETFETAPLTIGPTLRLTIVNTKIQQAQQKNSKPFPIEIINFFSLFQIIYLINLHKINYLLGFLKN